MWQHALRRLRTWGLIFTGGALVLLGALTFWLPLPIGLPLMLLGAPLLLHNSPHARRWWSQFSNRLQKWRARRRRKSG